VRRAYASSKCRFAENVHSLTSLKEEGTMVAPSLVSLLMSTWGILLPFLVHATLLWYLHITICCIPSINQNNIWCGIRYGLVARICRSHSSLQKKISADKAGVQFPVSESSFIVLTSTYQVSGIFLPAVATKCQEWYYAWSWAFSTSPATGEPYPVSRLPVQ
jgi:hypothetical protein